MNCKHIICPLVEISLIPLTQGKYAIVDTEDYEYLSQWKWQALEGIDTYYAVRKKKWGSRYKTLMMHRVILNTPLGMDTDHRNHNGLDNRKQNIRVCTRAENRQNQRPQKKGTSKYKGVRRPKNKWLAEIRTHSKSIHLGSYEIEIDAAKAYDAKAKELFGEFACTNF